MLDRAAVTTTGTRSSEMPLLYPGSSSGLIAMKVGGRPLFLVRANLYARTTTEWMSDIEIGFAGCWELCELKMCELKLCRRTHA